jgi:hypothetical protein
MVSLPDLGSHRSKGAAERAWTCAPPLNRVPAPLETIHDLQRGLNDSLFECIGAV